MKVPLLWFKSESDPWDVMLPTWSYEWLMLNSTSLWERALLRVSISTGKSLLEKLLKLNSLNPSRLSGYREDSTTYFWLIKHNSDSLILKASGHPMSGRFSLGEKKKKKKSSLCFPQGASRWRIGHITCKAMVQMPEKDKSTLDAIHY